jgi:hypothetical protein
VVKSLDLADIQALAASGAYGGHRLLSGATAALVLCSGVWLSELDNWQGADIELTQAEIDDIQAIVAELEYETMTESESAVGHYTKIAENIITEDVALVSLDDFDSGDFQSYELWITGLKTNYNISWIDHVQVQLNDDDTSADYDTLSIFEDVDSYARYENIGTFPGIEMYWAASTIYRTGAAIGHVKMLLYAPQGDDHKTVEWEGTASDYLAGRLIRTKGVGIYKSEDPIIKLEISPVEGSLFVVDPDNPDKPSELRMTLYGLS